MQFEIEGVLYINHSQLRTTTDREENRFWYKTKLYNHYNVKRGIKRAKSCGGGTRSGQTLWSIFLRAFQPYKYLRTHGASIHTRKLIRRGGPCMRTRADSVAKDDLPVSIAAVSL